MEKDILPFSDEEIQTLATRFKILSEPSRLRILRSLHNSEKCVTEIIESTGLLQANVSKQLQILHNNGIVDCKPVGLKRFYKITDTMILRICQDTCKTNSTDD